MPSRRDFMHSLVGAGAALPMFRETAMRHVVRATNRLTSANPVAAAEDEAYWGEIQRAFDCDRTMINLNNGGVSPAPRVVQDAMRRYLEFSNIAPARTMWAVLEPEVESVRRGLAEDFGCDPEEIAITRNASACLSCKCREKA